LQASGIKTIAATEKTDTTIYDISKRARSIMGSEDRGVNPSVLKIDEKAKLPMFGSIVP
jgi:23S rRNA (guanosine2251-2'-O)-methyltransferase